jgi:hypothetical protein
MMIGEVLVEEPIVMELGFWMNECAETKVNELPAV